MIPVELIIEGIYSYKERTRVDFQPLLAAQLFGIFGAVGSGKSSLLEAITFALYGQVERMTRRDSLAANMFNLDADQAFIQFTFDSLVDGQRYRCVATGKRRKQGPELSREFYRLTDDTPLPVEEAAVHEAIGLSYDHFTRTVIVPQGKFQAFLQLSDRERTDMLQHLFHLHRFDLAGPLRSLAGKTKGLEQHLSGQLASLERWLAIPLDDLQSRRTQLAQDQANCRQKLDQQIKRVARFQQFVNTLQSLAQARIHQDQFRDQLNGASTELDRAKLALLAAQQEAEAIPAIEARVADLRHCLEIQEVKAELDRATALLQQRTSSVEPIRQKLAENQRAANELDQQVAETQAMRVADQELTDRQTWMVQWKQLEAQRVDKERSGKEIRERVMDLEARYTGFWETIWDEDLIGTNLPSDPSQAISALLPQLEEQHMRWEESIRLEKHQAGISSFLDLLEEGTACPLCGSTHHPAPASADQHHQHIAALEKEATRTRQAIQSLRSWHDQSRSLANQVALEKERLEQMRKDYQQLQVASHQLSAQLTHWQLDIQSLGTWLAKQQTIATRIHQLQAALQVNRQEHVSLTRQLEDLSDQTRDLDQQRMRWTGRLDALMGQIAQLEDRDDILRLTSEGIHQRINDLEQTRSRLDMTLKSQQQAVQTREEHYLQTIVRLQEIERTVTELSDQLQLIISAIRELMPDWNEERWQQEAEQLLTMEQNTQTALQEEWTQSVASLALLDSQIRETTEHLEEARRLNEELKQVRNKLDNLKTLEGLFRAKGMVDFAASRYLRQILAHANQRFYSMTRHKLRLELSDDLRIMVRDYYHGGALRSVKTLSGGQLFQASLALALSLAEQIRSHRKGERDFFFLDEGFGTQDRESLIVVLDTLKALRSENRSVGIISHVEELQQEVNASLRIHLDPVRGSLIETSQ